jgi:hypothetical protein
MTEQYFIKSGKGYMPVNDPFALDGLTEGAWLVTVTKNCTSIRRAVDPEFIKLEAALRYLEDELCSALSKESEIRQRVHPIGRKITEKEERAWKNFRRYMGKDMPKLFEYASYQEVAEKGCAAIKKIMLENNMDLDKISKKYKKNKVSVKNVILDLEL